MPSQAEVACRKLRTYLLLRVIFPFEYQQVLKVSQALNCRVACEPKGRLPDTSHATLRALFRWKYGSHSRVRCSSEDSEKSEAVIHSSNATRQGLERWRFHLIPNYLSFSVFCTFVDLSLLIRPLRQCDLLRVQFVAHSPWPRFEAKHQSQCLSPFAYRR